MFTGILGVTQNHWVGLGKTLHTLNKLGQISRVLGLDGTTHNGGHTELHCLDTACILQGTDGSRLEQVLVNTDQSTSVTGGNISHLLCVTSHHDSSTLDVLDPELALLSRNVVRSHNTDLLSRGNLSREDTSESIETTLITGGNHLRNVHTQRSAITGIASTDCGCGRIIQRSVVEGIDTVRLGLGWRRQMKHNHLQHGISSRQPLLHNTLQELLSDEIVLLSLQGNSDGLEHLLDLSMLLVHDSIEKSGDGSRNELTESTLESTLLVTGGPHLTACIEIPVTPKLLHHLCLVDTELGTVSLSELLEGEGPLMKARSKSDGSLGGVNLNITERLVVVHGNNHVNRLDGTTESLVKLLSGELKFQNSTVDLVDHQNGAHTFANSLTKYCLGLYTHSINGIDNDQSSISNTEGSSHLTAEVNVTR
mmetsp:Transcript_9074/g.13552  ORF Transcript_9074/g.13552 Transcript_9074/m.13552 type:complete len:423 (+) Transcript_9074:1110-2378(+)